ncbi:hypothetical protein PLICRDRAFT_181566 [Plicaturopsis crispa FD-325 SS-3]|nr:hypothetical protein PLICRDRAFT_181566 [Plicaturopsis crispa FD-325 SS-3]
MPKAASFIRNKLCFPQVGRTLKHPFRRARVDTFVVLFTGIIYMLYDQRDATIHIIIRRMCTRSIKKTYQLRVASQKSIAGSRAHKDEG